MVAVGCRTSATPLGTYEYAAGVSQHAGELIMTTYGNGKNTTEANTDAIKDGMWVILFRGLPGSSQARPLIPPDQFTEFDAENHPYFNEFWADRYNSFLIGSSHIRTDKTKDAGFVSVVEIIINMDALRRDLEQNGIIRKFGLGE